MSGYAELIERFGRWLQNIGYDGGENSPPVQVLAAIAKLEAERDALVEALDGLLPTKLCGEGWNLPETETVAVTITFGKLNAARAILAKMEADNG